MQFCYFEFPGKSKSEARDTDFALCYIFSILFYKIEAQTLKFIYILSQKSEYTCALKFNYVNREVKTR